MGISVFPGTESERTALLVAVERYCACEREEAVVRGNCVAHSLLLNDVLLKRLIFYRRWRPALRRGEWLADPAWRTDPLAEGRGSCVLGVRRYHPYVSPRSIGS